MRDPQRIDRVLAAPEPAPLMSCGHPRSDLRGHDEATSYCAGCERESREPDPVPDSTTVTFADLLRHLVARTAAAPEQEKVPDSTPVTFAAILAYHRQRADDWRSADRPWHEEAVVCLRELALDTTRACHYESCLAGPYDSQRCHKAACPVWQARKAVEVET